MSGLHKTRKPTCGRKTSLSPLFQVGDDPSFVGTSTTASATAYPFQRKSFYANGYHYVLFSDGVVVKLFNSPNGVDWTERTSLGIKSISEGTKLSLFYSNAINKFDLVGVYIDRAILYRRFTPNSDGSITAATALDQVAVPVFMEEDGVYNGVTVGNPFWTFFYYQVSGSRYVLDVSAYGEFTEDWTTEVQIGSYGAGYKFVFSPYTTVTTPVGTSLPTTFQNKGWQSAHWQTRLPKKLWVLDGVFQAVIRVRNPDAIVHAGNLYARLWVSDYPDMSGATALTDWVGTSVSFSGTAGEYKDVTINFTLNKGVGDAFVIKGKYLQIEVLWDVVTAAKNARVQIEGRVGNSQLKPPQHVLYFPNVVIDSNGYPWIGFGRMNGYSYFQYIIKGNANDGTFDFRYASVRKLDTGGLANRYATPIPLTSGKMLVIYSPNKSQYFNGTSWGAEQTIPLSMAARFYHSAVANGDQVELAILEYTSYDIEHLRWTPDSWTAVATIQAAATSASAPVLSIDPATGNLYCFWAGSPTSNHIYYKKYSAGAWGALVDWFAESETLTGNDRLTGFYQIGDGKVGLMYMTLTASPYNVKYAFLPRIPRMVGDGLTWIVA